MTHHKQRGGAIDFQNAGKKLFKLIFRAKKGGVPFYDKKAVKFAPKYFIQSLAGRQEEIRQILDLIPEIKSKKENMKPEVRQKEETEILWGFIFSSSYTKM